MDKSNTLILTVHNKENTIASILNNVFSYTSIFTTHLVIVLDGCTDQSAVIVRKTVSAIINSSMNIRIIETDDIWETRANNIGLRMAETDYVTLMQDDMLLRQPQWDLYLAAVFDQYDVFAVTGRACHEFSLQDGKFTSLCLTGREFPMGSLSLLGRIVGRLMARIRPYWLYLWWHPLGFGLVANRGPLMLRRTLVQQLGYFDEVFAPFELDDVDLCCRAYKKWGLKSAALPIFYTEIEGSKATSSISSAISAKSIAKNTAILVERHSDLVMDP